MSHNHCPHCSRSPFGFWAKITLRPGQPRKCRHCGGVVSVSRRHGMLKMLMIGAVPLGACLLVIALTDGSTGWLLPVAGIVAGVLLELWLYHRLTPLVAHAD